MYLEEMGARMNRVCPAPLCLRCTSDSFMHITSKPLLHRLDVVSKSNWGRRFEDRVVQLERFHVYLFQIT